MEQLFISEGDLDPYLLHIVYIYIYIYVLDPKIDPNNKKHE